MNIVLMQTGNELSEIKLQALFFIIFSGRGELQVGADKGQNTARATGKRKRKRKGNILHMVKGSPAWFRQGIQRVLPTSQGKNRFDQLTGKQISRRAKKRTLFRNRRKADEKAQQAETNTFCRSTDRRGIGIGMELGGLEAGQHYPPTTHLAPTCHPLNPEDTVASEFMRFVKQQQQQRRQKKKYGKTRNKQFPRCLRWQKGAWQWGDREV